MPTSIHPVRVNHINMVLEDYDASVDHFRAAFGAEFLMDLPARDWHACLFEIGRVIFEIFAPNDFFLNARYGPHYFGIEYQADMDEVRAAIAERGIRTVRDIGSALHTHPADCFGIALEFYAGHFHDNEKLLGGPMKTPGWWLDEHPLGVTGLKACTVAVCDIEAASAFFRGLLSARPIYEAARPAVAGRAIGLQIADAVVELVTPTGDGTLRRHLDRCGDGIRSTVFGVRDLERARQYLAGRGIDLVSGTAPDALAVRAERNRGLIFEFAE